ncbi:hypothetical protein VTJ04DRAFT_1233 [Mycothermus thermophilus]|uniref:uncharacterized protein n=1 Tax=Humicola insolens TaxID=85995 RepID=UPI003743E407
MAILSPHRVEEPADYDPFNPLNMPLSMRPPPPRDDDYGNEDPADINSDGFDSDWGESMDDECPFASIFSSPSLARPPVMHFPHCRLDISTLDFPSPSGDGTTVQGKVERVGLPGSLVRTLIRGFDQYQQRWPLERQLRPRQPNTNTPTASSQRQHMILPHFEDSHDWVYTRCLLADFTGLREDDALMLSRQGRLCCWASVMLYPLEEEQEDRPQGERRCLPGADTEPGSSLGAAIGRGTRGRGGTGMEPTGSRQHESPRPHLWELRFVVSKVRVRDPMSGWCECFLNE